MKKQILYMLCATALLSSCHIYKSYDRPEDITTSGLYRDPVADNDTLVSEVVISSVICRGEKSSPTRNSSLSSKRD